MTYSQKITYMINYLVKSNINHFDTIYSQIIYMLPLLSGLLDVPRFLRDLLLIPTINLCRTPYLILNFGYYLWEQAFKVWIKFIGVGFYEERTNWLHFPMESWLTKNVNGGMSKNEHKR